MNRLHEFRRLQWLLKVQDILNFEKQRIMAGKLAAINADEMALEFHTNELVRLLEAEQAITKLSLTYDFDQDLPREEISQYVYDMLGRRPGVRP